MRSGVGGEDRPKVEFDLDLAGLPSRLTIDEEELRNLHLPLLRGMAERAVRLARPFVVLLAGPSGSGKTALAALWQELARQGRVGVPVQALPMDGFHFPNAVLDAHTVNLGGRLVPLRRIKGWPETFDLPALLRAVRATRAGTQASWPRYDRHLHDPIPAAIPVIRTGIVVVEGLFVLLDLPGWKELRAAAHMGYFLECEESLLESDLLTRRRRCGRSDEEAREHYELVDRYIYRLLMQHRHGVDVRLRVQPDRRLIEA